MRTAISRLIVFTLVYASASATAPAQSPNPHAADAQVQVAAPEMCCKGCAQKVSGQLYTLKGVRSVEVDIPARTVTVTLPTPSASTLGRVWQAIEQGDGGPTELSTATAAYRLVRPESEHELRAVQQMGSTQHVVVDNLHCNGCAQKIASQLYALKGVSKVSVDMQRETLIVETNAREPVSPWLVVEAVLAANERPVAVRGNYGALSISWAVEAAPKPSHQAQ